MTILHLRQGQDHVETKVSFNNFPDGDTHCLIESTAHVAGSRAFVRHFLYPNQNEQIMRLLLLLNTLRDLGAEQVEVFVPYLPYARQDKAHLPGESISSIILCRLLRHSGCNKLHTIDCHFMKGLREGTVEGLCIQNILVRDMLIEGFKKQINQPFRIIGPDAGSAYLADGETMKKSRSSNYVNAPDGSIHRPVESLVNEHASVNDEVLLVVDDMISTGSTMIRALEGLRDKGAQNIYAMVSHGLFLGGSLKQIQNLTQGLFYSDSVTNTGSIPVVDRIFENIIRTS